MASSRESHVNTDAEVRTEEDEATFLEALAEQKVHRAQGGRSFAEECWLSTSQDDSRPHIPRILDPDYGIKTVDSSTQEFWDIESDLLINARTEGRKWCLAFDATRDILLPTWTSNAYSTLSPLDLMYRTVFDQRNFCIRRIFTPKTTLRVNTPEHGAIVALISELAEIHRKSSLYNITST